MNFLNRVTDLCHKTLCERLNLNQQGKKKDTKSQKPPLVKRVSFFTVTSFCAHFKPSSFFLPRDTKTIQKSEVEPWLGKQQFSLLNSTPLKGFHIQNIVERIFALLIFIL